MCLNKQDTASDRTAGCASTSQNWQELQRSAKKKSQITSTHCQNKINFKHKDVKNCLELSQKPDQAMAGRNTTVSDRRCSKRGAQNCAHFAQFKSMLMFTVTATFRQWKNFD
jgi:hypothetical protein